MYYGLLKPQLCPRFIDWNDVMNPNLGLILKNHRIHSSTISIFSGNTMVRVHRPLPQSAISLRGELLPLTVDFVGLATAPVKKRGSHQWVVTHDGATNYPARALSVGPHRTQNPLHTTYNVDLGFPCEGFPRLIASVRKLAIVTYFYPAFEFSCAISHI